MMGGMGGGPWRALCVALLLAQGLSPLKRNKFDKTPHDIAHNYSLQVRACAVA